MTLPISDDGNQEQPAGGAESPASPPSGGQQGQQLPEYVSALMRQVEEQGKVIKGLQKGIDKRFERSDSQIKRILELKEQGLNESQIQRELWIDQQMQGQNPPPAEPVGNENTRQAPDVESAFKTVEEYGVSPNDPEFLALIRGSSRMDKATFDAKVKDLVLGKVKPPKPANPADIVQAPVKSGAQDKSLAQLEAEFQTEATKIAQTMRGDQKIRAIANLKAKYREAGLPK